MFVGNVWLYATGHTQCCVSDSSTCDSSQCDTKAEGDGQQIETTMVPATFRKHLVTIAAYMTKRKRLEEQSRATQGKEGEHAHHISRKWKVYNRNFQLFLFLRLVIKELALQVSESDSRRLISLYSHMTEFLYRYVPLL